MQYTEGPWWVEPSADGSADGREVCDGYGHTATVYGESDVAAANARLIAAAPELLEALIAAKGTIEYLLANSDNGPAENCIELIASAIAKAEGRTE